MSCHADFDDLDLEAKSQWLGSNKTQHRIISTIVKQSIIYKHARLNYVSRDLDFENMYMA